MFGETPLRTPQELLLMREAGRIVALVLEQMQERVAPGITTLDLDAAAEELIISHGGRPAFKGYRVPGKQPFPATLCTSVNDEVVHGIPNDTPLREGDIVGIDVGVEYQGFYGDTAVTLPVGQVAKEARRLMQVCAESLQQAINLAMKPGNALSEIGKVVQRHAEAHGFSVVRDFVGHGIGTELHQQPREVPNYATKRCANLVMEPGLVIAIEPMINAGKYAVAVDPDNEWVVRTADGRLSAHFEHTVAITPDGCQVLTLP
jgi:methionyl aminopeptidase